MTRWLQSATHNLFILTEAMAWFIVIRVFATTVRHAGLVEIRREIATRAELDEPRVLAALQVLDAAIDGGITAGPSLLVAAAAAFTAVYVSRAITSLRLPRSAAALAGMLASVLVLNALVHLTLAGDLRIWENAGLAGLFGGSGGALADPTPAEAFVRDPDVDGVSPSATAVAVLGMVMMWARFLYVGRGAVHFDRALRSFSVGFPIVMLAVLVVGVSGVAAAVFALPYFVLGMLTLAVANAARSSVREGQVGGAAPWAVSALVTLGMLASVATLFGLVAVLEVERAVTPVGEIVLRAVGWLLVLVLTPIAWAMELVLTRLLANFDPSVLDNLAWFGAEGGREELKPGDFAWPGWLVSALKLALFTAVTTALYFLGRYLFFGRRDGDEERDYAEERETTAGGGFGSLLRNLVPGRSGTPAVPRWLDRHAVYRLFARAVNDAGDRGFRRRPGETPIEFGTVAARALDAPPFPRIAAEFDRARYGRHYPDEGQVAVLERDLREWERTHPATEELRQRVERDQPPDEGLRPEPRRELPERHDAIPPDLI